MRQGRILASLLSTITMRGHSRGATLLDVVVGSALMTIVFVGITGAFQLSVDAVSNNKARAGAIALANEQLEYIRSLSYDAIGTVGGIPAGLIVQSATTSANNVLYTRRTFVSYEDDPGDGVGALDSNAVPTDFKAAKVSVSWISRQGVRTVTMATRISPVTGIEQAIPGGTIAIDVTDSNATPVSNAEVRVFNASTSPAIDLTTFTDAGGVASILGAPPGGGYAIRVTKGGYSTSETYSPSATNTSPTPAHLGVALNQTTASSFVIDTLSTYRVETFEAVQENAWTDSFADSSSISTSTLIEVSGGTAHLVDAGGYVSGGTLIASAISVPDLSEWSELSWSDSLPAGTSITYQLFDDSFQLIPDSEVPGNSIGFTTSPISLTGISTTTHALIRPGATLITNDASSTPALTSWTLAYRTGPTPLANISFTLQGAKTIGSWPGGPAYKYSVLHTSGATAGVTLTNIEFDSYTLTVDGTNGFDISSSCSSQPVSILPGVNIATRLYFEPHSTNSLLVDVKSGGAIIPGASVRLSRGAYDATLSVDQCGYVFFGSLSTGSVGTGNPYTIEVSAPGYTTYTSSEVTVSGTGRLSVILN